MSNALVRGKAPAIQVAGALSPGIFFQNLGNYPVYLGYEDQAGPAVTAASCDGVIQPGGSYAVGPKKNVFLYADNDCAVVWNFDAVASADGGQNAVVSGSVSSTITNKPDVNIPGGVAINGPVAITGGVGINGPVTVAGNVGIVGNVGIAGNVNVQGSLNVANTVNSKTQQTLTTIYSNGDMYQYPGNDNNYSDNNDVSAYATIVVSVVCNNPQGGATAGMVNFDLVWKDYSGNRLLVEGALCWCNGNMTWITPVKGPILELDYHTDANINNPTRFNVRVQAATTLMHEKFYSWMPNPDAYNGTFSNGISIPKPSRNVGQKTAGYTINLPGNGYGIQSLGGHGGRGRIAAYCGGNTALRVRFGKFGLNHSDIQPEVTVDTLNTNIINEFLQPRAPMFIEHIGGSGGGSTYVAVSWE